MSALTDFLLARLAEEEAAAHAILEYVSTRLFWGPDVWWPWVYMTATDFDDSCYGFMPGVMALSPARVLADCDAKRHLFASANRWRSTGNASLALCAERVERHLALPYADHPDYREEWRA